MCMTCELLKKRASYYGKRSIHCKICNNRSRFSKKRNAWIDAPKASNGSRRNPVRRHPFSSRRALGRAHSAQRGCAR